MGFVNLDHNKSMPRSTGPCHSANRYCKLLSWCSVFKSKSLQFIWWLGNSKFNLLVPEIHLSRNYVTMIKGYLNSSPCLCATCPSIFLPSWWRHQMETFSALLAFCAPTGEFPTQRPVTRSFDIFFYLCLDPHLSKQFRSRWFQTPARSLWHQCNWAVKVWFTD